MIIKANGPTFRAKGHGRMCIRANEPGTDIGQ